MKRAGLILLVATAAFGQNSPLRLTLTEAEELALRNNPRIAAAEYTAQAAGQVPAQYRSGLFPNMAANFTGAGASSDTRIGAGGLNNPSIFSRMATGVSVNQLLFDFGRTSHLTSSAGYHARAQEDTAAATRASTLLDVHRAFYGALRAQAIVQVSEQTVAARQTVADQVRALTDAKLKSGLDLSFASVNLAEARLLLESARNDRYATNANLATILGLPVVSDFDVVDERPVTMKQFDLNRLIDDALRKRPEVTGGKMQLEAANEFAAAEKKLKYPTFSAVGSIGAIPLRVDTLHTDTYAAGGLNISLPFLNGGLYKARQREAELRALAAERQLKDTENQVARTVRLAYLNLTTARERMRLTDQLLDHASQALDLAQARYDLGLSSIVELSQAQLAKTQAEIQQVSARYDYQVQQSVLEYETGSLK